MNKIFQLRINLIDSNPEIYRTIQINSRFTFYQLHLVMQKVMGWENYHLYEFKNNNICIIEKDEFAPDNSIEPGKISIDEVLMDINDSINYIYDFGDEWQHEIKVEKIISKRTKIQYPRCIKGQGNCPPEDSGGLYGYYEKLEILEHPDNQDYKDIRDWMGEKFDPHYFNLEEVNYYLQQNDLSDNENIYESDIDTVLSLDDVEGYSEEEINSIINDTFEVNWPIVIKTLDKSSLQQIPILNMIKYLMETIHSNNEIKLTVRGNLPRKLVLDLYNQKFIINHDVEEGWLKITKEADSHPISLSHFLIKFANLAKKRKNKLSLTKLGEKALKDGNLLLNQILIAFCTKLNWGYFNRYQSDMIGEFGFGFSLILISKYGSEKRYSKFYSDKYFKIFPYLKMEYSNKYFSKTFDINHHCYSSRTFRQFLDLFGLITIDKPNKNIIEDKLVMKTKLFDKIFAIIPPASICSMSVGES